MCTSGLVLITVGVLLVILIIIYILSRRKLRKKLELQSQIVQTVLGPIEYIDIGDGPVVFHAHGMLGGIDHVRWCQFIVDAGFRVILPSRPGYLRTSIAIAKTPKEQADLYAALLDTLKVDRVAFYAISQGGASLLEFALAHPEKCWGIILLSAFTRAQPELEKILSYVRILMSLDFLMWLLKPIMLPLIMRQASRTLSESDKIDRKKIEDIRQVFSAVFQASLRGQGLTNDFYNLIHWTGIPLERVNIPTIIFHGTNDALVPYDHSVNAAQLIPGAAFESFDGAGHEAFVTHPNDMEKVLIKFLRQHAPI